MRRYARTGAANRAEQVEMAAEVEEGNLSDLIAGALGGDETEREIRFYI
jgi:hypothetical protein